LDADASTQNWIAQEVKKSNGILGVRAQQNKTKELRRMTRGGIGSAVWWWEPPATKKDKYLRMAGRQKPLLKGQVWVDPEA